MKEYAYFLGCITPLRYPGIEAVTIQVMKEYDISLLPMKGASCCPAPGVFGSFDLLNWLVLASRNLVLAEAMGVDATTTCNGCYGTLQEASHLLEDPDRRQKVNKLLKEVGLDYKGRVHVFHIIDLIINEIGLDTIKKHISNNLNGLKVAAHYGCHYLKPRKVRQHGSAENPSFLDELIRTLGGTSLDYRDKQMCCGAGGGVRASSPDVSQKFTLEKIQNMKAVGAECILTTCAFCHLQFDKGQADLLKKGLIDSAIPVIFVTQLIGLATGIPAEKLGIYENDIPPTYLEH